MTNREKIMSMANEELANLLVVATEVEEIDYDWDEEPCSRLETQYGNCVIGWYDWEDEAILAAIDWLNREEEENLNA